MLRCAFLVLLFALGDSYAPLYLYHSASRSDYAAFATEAGVEWAKPDYNFVHNCTQLVSNTTHAENTVPLYTYYSSQYKDTANAATPESLARLQEEGYKFQRIEGYIYFEPPDGILTSPLVLFWNEELSDLFLTGCPADEQMAVKLGYVPVGIEGYAPVEFRDWNGSPPPGGCPFEKSTTFTGLQLSFRAGVYGRAEAWFSSWGSDGNMYMTWAEGTVNGTSCGHENRTIGYAVASGDDPLNLNITNVGCFESYPEPYAGRYPSASLIYDRYWYYGTYALDSIPENPQNCSGKCYVQGPFLDFLYSPVASPVHPPQWNDPRFFLASDTDNLFDQTSKNSENVKFGAMHVVDFGQTLEPEGTVYLIGHGSDSSSSDHESWMEGDGVYLARGYATDPIQINNASAWKFYGGMDSANNSMWMDHLEDATPLFKWNNHTGSTSMTYLPALKKFITCVSTPTKSPYSTRNFDTYFLESDSMLGPYKLIVYLSEFGPEAYDVTIPPKFAATKYEEFDGEYYYSFYLSYSANFAVETNDPQPPGSQYSWVLSEARFKAKV